MQTISTEANLTYNIIKISQVPRKYANNQYKDCACLFDKPNVLISWYDGDNSDSLAKPF